MKEEKNLIVNGTEWKGLQDKAYEKVSKSAKVDGFRPGKAPRDMYEKKYGKQDIMMEAADMAIKHEYERLLTDEKITPVIEPKVNLVKCDEEELEVKFEFVVEPKIELGKYTNLGIKMDKVKVTKEEVENRIKSLLDEYAEIEVKDGSVEDGDIAVIDFTGFKDGVEFEGGKGENYSLTIGSKSFIPGFEDAIIGMKKGEEKDIDLTFPEDYMAEELKGKAVVFKVKVNEIKTRVVPKIDKEFFEDLGMEGVTTKEELEHEIKHELEHQKEHEAEHVYEEKCLDKAAENMKCDICEELVMDEVEHMYKEFIERMQMQGISEEMYFQYTKAKKEDITDQMKPEALKRIKYRYLLKEIIKVEKIKVTDKEAKDRVKEMSKMYQVSEEVILKELSLEHVKLDKMYQKAMDLVCANEEKKKD
ncbi:MAG: trigger factor [Erysipelotrichaceae bacterium]|nr:trigger factor [Erysipelotrichaceae bacterium]